MKTKIAVFFKLPVLAMILVLIGSLFAQKTGANLDAPKFSRDLVTGSVGDDVKDLQRFLNDVGYPVASRGAGSKGNETYYYGSLTKNALAKFQAAHGLNATGTLDSATRDSLSNNDDQSVDQTANTSETNDSSKTKSKLELQIDLLKQQIVELQKQLKSLANKSAEDNNADGPTITAIDISDNGNEGYIDNGDIIKITFDKTINPESVNEYLKNGNEVTNITKSETGGVSVSSNGIVTIKNIASFDMGSVKKSGDFTAQLALNSNGKILTITLMGGDDIKVMDENFKNTEQVGGIVQDKDGKKSEDKNIDEPTGTFGGAIEEINTTENAGCYGEGQGALGMMTSDTAEKTCCAGLVQIGRSACGDNSCSVISDTEGYLCTKCGDGACGIGENKTNCAKDCDSASNYGKDQCTASGGSWTCKPGCPSCNISLTKAQRLEKIKSEALTGTFSVCQASCVSGSLDCGCSCAAGKFWASKEEGCINNNLQLCGNGKCEAANGETSAICPADCPAETCYGKGEGVAGLTAGPAKYCCAGLTAQPRGGCSGDSCWSSEGFICQ